MSRCLMWLLKDGLGFWLVKLRGRDKKKDTKDTERNQEILYPFTQTLRMENEIYNMKAYFEPKMCHHSLKNMYMYICFVFVYSIRNWL